MRICRLHGQLLKRRAAVADMELELTDAFRLWLAWSENSLRNIARKMELSPAYLSDIQHGKRKVSDEVVKRLERLK